jgi:hypothetical protein
MPGPGNCMLKNSDFVHKGFRRSSFPFIAEKNVVPGTMEIFLVLAKYKVQNAKNC